MKRLLIKQSRERVGLDQISTRWPFINDPTQFVTRYALAIRNYFFALVKNPHDAEELSQDFLLRALRRGFHGASPDRGRFRDYLKIAVRNAALTYLRHRKTVTLGESGLAFLPDAGHSDRNWLADWQRCLLDRAWHALEKHERCAPGNLYHTVLRLTADYPDEDSKALAERASALIDRPLRPEAFRKQLSRARRLFTELLVAEVRQTLDKPTPEAVEEELTEVGLIAYVRDFLSPGMEMEDEGEARATARVEA